MFQLKAKCNNLFGFVQVENELLLTLFMLLNQKKDTIRKEVLDFLHQLTVSIKCYLKASDHHHPHLGLTSNRFFYRTGAKLDPYKVVIPIPENVLNEWAKDISKCQIDIKLDDPKVWRNNFVLTYYPDYAPLKEGDNLFIINYQENEYQEKITSLSTNHKNVFISLNDIEPIINSPQLLSLIVENEIKILQEFNDSSSLLINSLTQAFSKILNQGKEQKAAIAKKASDTASNNADSFALNLRWVIQDIEKDGKKSLRKIAEELTERKVLTARNNLEWSAMSVKHVKDRLNKLDNQ